jgi:FAD/FMN-containing dehydrogenase
MMSWGRYLETKENLIFLKSGGTVPPRAQGQDFLAFGLGRSYGDCCLNSSHTLLMTRQMSRIIEFDKVHGTVTAEAGVTLEELIDVTLPMGWFPAVVPGTKHVTLGGAVANDVHGKNHYLNGSFGNHVICLILNRADGERLRCSRVENSDYFRATIGGLGLTGLITEVKIQLRKITGTTLNTETIPFYTFDEFLSYTFGSLADFEYIVAWVDSGTVKNSSARGFLFRANHAGDLNRYSKPRDITCHIHINNHHLKRVILSTISKMYDLKNRFGGRMACKNLDEFLFPLYRIKNWNLFFGKSGFVQFQCLIPKANFANNATQIFSKAAGSGHEPFLSVLKVFGSSNAVGALSFPHEGISLSMDLFFKGPSTLELINELNHIVLSMGGRVYAAKDCNLSAEDFKSMYPSWKEFESKRDLAFSSNFWRRVTE